MPNNPINDFINLAINHPGENLYLAAEQIFANFPPAPLGAKAVVKELAQLMPGKRRLVCDLIMSKTGVEVAIEPEYLQDHPVVMVSPIGEKPVIHNVSLGDLADVYQPKQ